MSDGARRTVNPIRKIVDSLDLGKLAPSSKKLIALSIGDPTKYPCLPICQNAIDSIIDIIKQHQHNGYPPSSGLVSAREAIAEKYT